MKRIEKLTPEQEARFPEWRDKWIAIGLKTGETDWDTAEENIKLAYKKANIKFPNKPIIHVQSPLVGAFASSIADKIINEGDAVEGAVGGAVEVAVRDAVGDAVEGAVGGAVEGAVRVAVGGAKLSWHYWLGGQFWVGYWWGSPSYVSFFTDVCGLELRKDIQERAWIYQKICMSANFIWCNRDFVMICARPIRISRNERGQLHHTKLKAIEYPDGWGVYMLNGIRFSEELFKKITSENVTAKDILSIEDVDQRTQAMRFMPAEAMMKELKGELLDEYDKLTIEAEPVNYRLYKFPKGDVFTEDAYYVLFDCPSTRKKHLEGVEVSKTIAQAMSWAEEISEEEWCARIPLIHEV